MKPFRLFCAVFLLVAATAAMADEYPTVAISDTVWPEGDGATEGYVTFTLSQPYQYDIGVSIRMYTPAQINDYYANVRFDCGTCRIPAGSTSAQLKILIDGNDSYQSLQKEWYGTAQYVIAGGPGGFLPSSGANFSIDLTEDDPIPEITLADATVTEPESGIYWLAMTFQSSAPVTGSVAWRTIDETATYSVDYIPGWQHPEFYGMESPFKFHNTSTAVIGFGIGGDSLDEPDESFLIELYDPHDLTLARTLVRVTIIDSDEALPTITASDVTVAEGDDGITNAIVTFTASAPVTGSFNWSTANGSATTEEHDYQGGNGTITMNGSTTATLVVPVFGDVIDESNESFRVDLHDPVNVLLGTQNVAVTIVDDDEAGPAPVLMFTPQSLVLYSGQWATVQASLMSDEAAVAVSIPLHSAGDAAIDAAPSVFLPDGRRGALTITGMSPGNATIACSGSVHCDPLTIQVLAQELDRFTPHLASMNGGTEVTLHGTGFSETCSVDFGGTPALTTTVVSLETIRAVAPAHRPGKVHVTVTCGSTTTTPPELLEYVVPRGRAVRH
jgi:hypothetical protein